MTHEAKMWKIIFIFMMRWHEREINILNISLKKKSQYGLCLKWMCLALRSAYLKQNHRNALNLKPNTSTNSIEKHSALPIQTKPEWHSDQFVTA